MIVQRAMIVLNTPWFQEVSKDLMVRAIAYGVEEAEKFDVQIPPNHVISGYILRENPEDRNPQVVDQQGQSVDWAAWTAIAPVGSFDSRPLFLEAIGVSQ